jgi:hypothetical protein
MPLKHTEPPAVPTGPTLTVSEIAGMTILVSPDPVATLERIRHWTRERLIVPIAQEHAGGGKHRGYAEDTAYDVAVLIAVANMGLHVTSTRYLADALTMLRQALPRWKEARARGRVAPLFLDIFFLAGPSGSGGTAIDVREDRKPVSPQKALAHLKESRPDFFDALTFIASVITVDCGVLFDKVFTSIRNWREEMEREAADAP